MLILEPLTPEAFAPFGEVLAVPQTPGRVYYSGALASLRPAARPSLSLVRKEDFSSLPLQVTQMERHELSSQSFVPIEAGRWLVLVAPHTAAGGPDMRHARAFIAGPDQGVTYAANTWHHPLTILAGPAVFAVYMWLDGSTTDEEFVSLPSPVTVAAA
jgi:ureidoglycolate lyase